MTMPKTCWSLAAALVIAMAAQSAPAQEATFGDQTPRFEFSKTPVGKAVSTLNPMNWKMPKFKRPAMQQVLPTQVEKQRIKERKNSLVSEVSQTASRSWKKTKQVLNPKRLLPTNLFAAGPEQPQPPQQQEVEQVGFFEQLLRPMTPEPDQGTTVNDFLKQDRP